MKFEQLKTYINKEKLSQLIIILKIKLLNGYTLIKHILYKLTKKQRIALLLSLGVIVLVLVLSSVLFSTHKKEGGRGTQAYPITFETQAKSAALPAANDTHEQLASQLSTLQDTTNQQYQGVKDQLQAIQGNLGSLASQHDVKQLQQSIQIPNTQLLGAVDNLQQSVQQIVRQTAKKVWVDPKTVEHYFRLVAVQGFSDGMRAIIDVDGNQTVLSENQPCPVCRGWVLKSMDFTNQSAIFTKKEKDQISYVKLQAN